MSALAEEIQTFAAAVTEREKDMLKRAGVRPAAKWASQIDNWLPPIGVSPGAVAGDLWEPREIGEEFFVVPVAGHGELIDLVAWRPTDARRWWLRRGDGELLGLDRAERAALFSDPLRVFATPLAWLAAGGDGVAVLRWPEGAWWLQGLRLITESRSLAGRLDAAINASPQITQIFVKVSA